MGIPTVEQREYFICWYRLCSLDSYLVWYGHGPEGVITDRPGHVRAFLDRARAISYADELGIELKDEEPILHDLDAVQTWVRAPAKDAIGHDLLTAWNLFSDVAASVGETQFDADRDLTTPVYGKLFWGPSLPEVSASNRACDPTWADHEVAVLRDVLNQGLDLFRRHVGAAGIGEP